MKRNIAKLSDQKSKRGRKIYVVFHQQWKLFWLSPRDAVQNGSNNYGVNDRLTKQNLFTGEQHG